MCADNAGSSENPIKAAASELEVDRTPLPLDQLKQLFDQIKLEEGTSNWTEEQCSKV